MLHLPRGMFLLILSFSVFACYNAPTGSDHSTSDEGLIGEEANWSEEGDFEEKVSTYEDDDRDIWQKPERVIDLMGPLEGKTVVDIGAGSGYFAFRCVPEAEKVIAVDIDPDFVAFLENKKALLSQNQQEKFEVRLASPDDPMLDDNEVDAVLLVNTYAYIENRIAYFKALKPKIRENGKIVIIEFKMKTIPNGPPPEEKIAMHQVEHELQQAGYDRISTDDQTLDYQYIITVQL